MVLTTRLITVVLVEDHPLARSGVRQFLGPDDHIKIVGEAENGDKAINLISRLRPDLAIVDIRLGQRSALDVVRSAKTVSPDTKILILTAYDDERYVSAFVRLGVAGYLMKSVSSEELRTAVHDAAAGRLVLGSEVAPTLTRLLRESAGRPPAKSGTRRCRRLTAREVQILERIAQGFKNREIAVALGVSVKTVEAHVEHVLQKLGVASRTEAVVHAFTNGWLLEASE